MGQRPHAEFSLHLPNSWKTHQRTHILPGPPVGTRLALPSEARLSPQPSLTRECPIWAMRRPDRDSPVSCSSWSEETPDLARVRGLSSCERPAWCSFCCSQSSPPRLREAQNLFSFPSISAHLAVTP